MGEKQPIVNYGTQYQLIIKGQYQLLSYYKLHNLLKDKKKRVIFNAQRSNFEKHSFPCFSLGNHFAKFRISLGEFHRLSIILSRINTSRKIAVKSKS